MTLRDMPFRCGLYAGFGVDGIFGHPRESPFTEKSRERAAKAPATQRVDDQSSWFEDTANDERLLRRVEAMGACGLRATALPAGAWGRLVRNVRHEQSTTVLQAVAGVEKKAASVVHFRYTPPMTTQALRLLRQKGPEVGNLQRQIGCILAHCATAMTDVSAPGLGHSPTQDHSSCDN